MTSRLAQEHADSIAALRTLADTIPVRAVAHAFVASLGSRNLPARSALGSYALARVIPDHDLTPRTETFATICQTCGWSRMPPGHESLEEDYRAHFVLERKRYGGVSHLDPAYALYDLSEFRALESPTPTGVDWRALDLVLRTPTLLAPDAKAADLERALKEVFKSNRHERATVIRILAYTGILEDPAHPGFFQDFRTPDERELPPHRFTDWGYPAIWWRAKHGVRTAAVAFWFPESAAAAVA